MRYVIGIICISLIVLRAVFPDIKFDNISLILLIFGLIVLLFPELRELISRMKKFKFGEFEVELGKELKKLTTKTEKAEENIPEISIGEGNIVQSEFSLSYDFLNKKDIADQPIRDKMPKDILGSDPRAALLLISVEIEKKLRDISVEEIPEARRLYPMIRIINSLTEKRILHPDIIQIFKDFWAIRNRVVHGQHFELSSGKLYEMIELGRRILRLLPVTIHEILERLKEDGINILVKPIEPIKYEKDEFYIEKVEETITLKNLRLGQYVYFPYLEIEAVDNLSFPPILYLRGKLKWNSELGMSGLLEYIPSSSSK